MQLRDRVLAIASAVRAAAAKRNGVSKDGVLGLWPDCEAARFRFADTPASARVACAPDEVVDLLRHERIDALARRIQRVRRLRQIPAIPNAAPGQLPYSAPLAPGSRPALYVFLASEMSLVRWATFSAVVCCLAVALFAYLFPVSGASAFILFNLGLLIAIGMFSGHAAVMFERDDVLSNVLCNSTRKLQFSPALFNYIAFPVVVLAVVIGVAQVPGVLDWSGGLVDWLLRLAGGGMWT